MTALGDLGPSLPALARRAIVAKLAGEPLVPEPAGPPAPVFVTLRDAEGDLRGCVGTLVPSSGDVASETARAAVLAALSDPRFSPVLPSEVDDLKVEVTVLGAEEEVLDESELNPDVYGVIVMDGHGRRGVLLPGIPSVRDAATQVAIARQKAGIRPDAKAHIRRFPVQKWSEEA